MSTELDPRPMTAEDLIVLPDDDVERDLIRGELRERPMTRRNRKHSRATSRVCYLLERWLETQPEPRGEVVGGEAGFRLRRDPDTTVGIDVAYVPAERLAATPERAAWIEGPPLLAVEILLPSDTKETIDEKIEPYLESGVALVWIVDPRFRTVTVYRPDAEPSLFNADQEITAEPHLPGFRAPVAAFFGR